MNKYYRSCDWILRGGSSIPEGFGIGTEAFSIFSVDVWVLVSVVLPEDIGLIRSVWITCIAAWYEGIKDSNESWLSVTVRLIGNWILDTPWLSARCRTNIYDYALEDFVDKANCFL